MDYCNYIDKLNIKNIKTNVNRGDVLIIVDMQNDFVPNTQSSSFAVKEGDMIIDKIKILANQFLTNNSFVIATRDYHPLSHVSFKDNGGIFPSHCVQGTHGSEIVPEIAEILFSESDKTIHNNAFIVFKGIDKSIDSYGASKYTNKYRNRCFNVPFSDIQHCQQKSGAFHLFNSTHSRKFKINEKSISDFINAPPDITFDIEKLRMENMDCINKAKNIFIVGLALDFCVIDTAINLSQHVSENQKVYIIPELSRLVVSNDRYITPINELLKMKEGFDVEFIKLENIN